MLGQFIIYNTYSARNLGDAAIVLASHQLLLEAGARSVEVSSRYFEADEPFYAAHGIPIRGPLLPFPLATRSSQRPRQALGMARGLLASMTPRHIDDDSTLVACGGGYLYSGNRKANLTYIHALAQIGYAATGSNMIMPQSLGPIAKRRDRALLLRVLSRLDQIAVRESESMALLQSLDQSLGDRTTLVPDVVFGLAAKDLTARDPSSSPRVGISVMDWTWAGAEQGALQLYVAKMIETCRLLSDLGIEIILFGNSTIAEHDQDDIRMAEEILQQTSSRLISAASVEDVRDMAAYSDLVRHCDAVIGTRLHSSILAMIHGTPSIHLSYQPKGIGTYKLLGHPGLAINVNDFRSDDLASRAQRLLSVSSLRSSVIDAVRAAGDGVRAWVRETVNRLPDLR